MKRGKKRVEPKLCAFFCHREQFVPSPPHNIGSYENQAERRDRPDRGHSSIFAPWSEYGQSAWTPPTPQSGIGTIRKLTFQSTSWVRWLPGRNLPPASIVPVMSKPDSSTHLTRPFGCKRAWAVRHWDPGLSRIPSILPQQEGHQGAPLPRLVHMKYLAVVTVACCDFIGHVLPGQATLPRDSMEELGLFNIQIVICHPAPRWDCFSPAEQLQHPPPLPGSSSFKL